MSIGSMGGVRGQRGEVVRLCRVAMRRPRWQQVVAFVVSLWTLAWIIGHLLTPVEPPTALDVLVRLGTRLGVVDGAWAHRLARAWQEGGASLVVLGGLLWAATSERGQLPALIGWVAVMLGAEGLGYRPAILFALTTMVGFVVMLWIAAQVARRLGHATLLPPDVLRAGVTAAALSAMVPLFAPMLFLSRLSRPYLAKGPRKIPSARTGDEQVSDTTSDERARG